MFTWLVQVDGIKGVDAPFIHAVLFYFFIGFILNFCGNKLVINNQKYVASYNFRYSIKLRNLAVCSVFRKIKFYL
ncbi:hypothetical protein ABE51_16020 [Bacillus thuringiensis]|nr:hypothetical protein [Bacillus thuringiensis]